MHSHIDLLLSISFIMKPSVGFEDAIKKAPWAMHEKGPLAGWFHDETQTI